VTSDIALGSEQIMRRAYKVAEDKDIGGWIAAFTEDVIFTDQSTGVTYRGPDELPITVENYARAFPDMPVFPGLSVISGPADAPASVRDLRANAFVDSLADTRAQLAESGWTTEGSLGAGNSLLARDRDGMLAEFVEIPGGTA